MEIEIPGGDMVGGISSPKCACGGKMKKVYSPPVLQKLSKAEAIKHFGDFGAAKEFRKKSRSVMPARSSVSRSKAIYI
jgi:hypothetical protein